MKRIIFQKRFLNILTIVMAISLFAFIACQQQVDIEAPTIPQGVTAEAISSSQINLSWSASTDNIGVTGYHVYRDGEEIASVAQTSYFDTGLSANTPYSYTVSAYDTEENESTQSIAACATTKAESDDTESPLIPQGLTAEAVSSSQINLCWSASTDNVGVTGYRIYRNGNPTPIATTEQTTYSDTGLFASTEYTYTVSAFDAAGNESEKSDPVTETTDVCFDDQKPTVPQNLIAEAISPSQINLSWSASTDNVGVAGYHIYRNANSSPIATLNTTTYSDTGLSASTTYSYTVSAYDAAGNNSDLSASVIAVTLDASITKIIDHLYTDLTIIPVSAINQAKASLHIAYGHTSHGSQLTTGMSGLVGFINGGGLGLSYPVDLFKWNDGVLEGTLDLDDYAMGGDAGYYPAWVNNTTAYLGDPDPITGRGTLHPDVNVIIWSWCGQVSSKTEETMISEYLAPMSQLESDYPGIIFVYMTGHLNGTGITGNLHLRNEQIRNYCIANNKWLYDFADIESYDPDGNYYLDKLANDNCDYDSDGNGSLDSNWATSWQSTHTLGVDWYNCSAAHSQSLNGNRKAYAAWWLWARLAGWDGISD